MGKAAEIMAHQMKKQGHSYRDIARSLGQTFGEDISHQGVKNYFEQTSKERLARMGQKNAEKLQKKKQEQLIEVEDQLERMNGLLEEILTQFEEKGVDAQDLNWLTQLSKELRNHWKFTRKYLDDVVPDKQDIDTQINITENKTQTAIKISNHLEKLEEEGIITINEPHKIGSVPTTE